MSRWMISAEQLQALTTDEVVIIDCRFSLQDSDAGESLYSRGHIPGAHYLHLERDLSGQKGMHGGRHPLPPIDLLATKLGEMGVGPDTLVVAYDDGSLGFAARLWWLLRYLGHDKVKLLDGGIKAWREAGFGTDDQAAVAQAKNFVADVRHDMVVDINTVKTIPLLPSAVLIDSRDRARFLGQQEPIDPIAGHINGAKNYPWSELTNDQMILLSEQQQRERWGSVLEQEDIVCYCGSGVSACVNLLSLAETGREDAQLYVGSWSDWCSYLTLK